MIQDALQGEVTETARRLVGWLLASGEVALLAVALFVLALSAAKLVELVLRAVLRRTALDAWAGRLGLDSLLGGPAAGRPLTWIVSRIAFLVTLLFVAQVTADALGLSAVAGLMSRVLAYAPRVIAAGVILLAGTAAAGYARRVVIRAAGDSGIEYASALGGIVFAVILFALGLMAIAQLQISIDAVWLVTGWLLGGLALALGLSFGLGARDITRNILAGFYARRIFRIGQTVELQGQRGVLLSITPTNALIDQDDAVVSISNSRLLGDVVRQPK